MKTFRKNMKFLLYTPLSAAADRIIKRSRISRDYTSHLDWHVNGEKADVVRKWNLVTLIRIP